MTNKTEQPRCQIRSAVFETNSSSSHSLTLNKGQLSAMPFPKETLRDGVIELVRGDYHWEYFRYYSAKGKAQYLLTQCSRGSELSTEGLREENPNVATLCAVIEEYTGCRVEVLSGEGSIDHYSEGKHVDIFTSREALQAFLFDESSCVQTGNDNSPAPWLIETCKGREFAYQASFKTPNKSSVALKVVIEGYSFDMQIDQGLVLSEVSHPALYSRLLKRGVVTEAELARPSYYRNDHPSLDARGALADQLMELGLKISPEFQAVEKLVTPASKGKPVQMTDRKLTLTVRVPPSLKRALAALKPWTPAQEALVRNHLALTAAEENLAQYEHLTPANMTAQQKDSFAHWEKAFKADQAAVSAARHKGVCFPEGYAFAPEDPDA